MINRDKGRIVLTCDGCGQSERDDKWRPYPERWREAQAKGWAAQAVNGGKTWKHFCPECKATAAA